MIERIEIHNFQSHKATVLDLDPKVNTLQGNSDCGKSAVLRALHWLIFNPAGDYFISDWARKGKTQVAPCEVIMYVDGHKVVRRRDKDFNGYILDDEVFEATRNTVPQKVLDLLGMAEVNVQRQLDPPFLLSMSAGEVSRYINNLVNLTRIDRWTTAANSRERKLMQDADAALERIGKASEAVESYSYLPRLEELAKEASELDDRRCKQWSDVNDMRSSLDRHSATLAEIGRLPDIERLESILSNVDNLVTRKSALSAEVDAAKSSVDEHQSKTDEVAGIVDVDRVGQILSEIPGMSSRHDSVSREVVVLSRELEEHSSNETRLQGVPVDSLVEVVSTLERLRNVRSNISASEQHLASDMRNHKRWWNNIRSIDEELPALVKQLDGMVCPLCGRRGIHEEA